MEDTQNGVHGVHVLQLVEMELILRHARVQIHRLNSMDYHASNKTLDLKSCRKPAKIESVQVKIHSPMSLNIICAPKAPFVLTYPPLTIMTHGLL